MPLKLLLASLIALAAMGAPPKVGERAPDFSLTSLAGKTMRLSAAAADGPVVLLVLRGYPGYQCPYCTRQVQDFVRHAPAFAGTTVLLVYPGPAADLEKMAREFAANKQLPENFHLLLDPDYKFTELYGLRWNAKAETAYPSTFLIDKKGVVFFEKVSDAHGGRTSAADMADLLKAK